MVTHIFNTYQCESMVEDGPAGSKGAVDTMPVYLENSLANPQDSEFSFHC